MAMLQVPFANVAPEIDIEHLFSGRRGRSRGSTALWYPHRHPAAAKPSATAPRPAAGLSACACQQTQKDHPASADVHY